MGPQPQQRNSILPKMNQREHSHAQSYNNIDECSYYEEPEQIQYQKAQRAPPRSTSPMPQQVELDEQSEMELFKHLMKMDHTQYISSGDHRDDSFFQLWQKIKTMFRNDTQVNTNQPRNTQNPQIRSYEQHRPSIQPRNSINNHSTANKQKSPCKECIRRKQVNLRYERIPCEQIVYIKPNYKAVQTDFDINEIIPSSSTVQNKPGQLMSKVDNNHCRVNQDEKKRTLAKRNQPHVPFNYYDYKSHPFQSSLQSTPQFSTINQRNQEEEKKEALQDQIRQQRKNKNHQKSKVQAMLSAAEELFDNDDLGSIQEYLSNEESSTGKNELADILQLKDDKGEQQNNGIFSFQQELEKERNKNVFRRQESISSTIQSPAFIPGKRQERNPNCHDNQPFYTPNQSQQRDLHRRNLGNHGSQQFQINGNVSQGQRFGQQSGQLQQQNLFYQQIINRSPFDPK